MEKMSGQIGSSGINYEVSVDNELNVRVSLVAPLVPLLGVMAEKSGNQTVIAIEKFVVEMAKAYEATKVAGGSAPAIAAPAVAPVVTPV